VINQTLIYFVYNPFTGGGLTEVAAAAYSKVFGGDLFGLSNATKKVKEIEDIYGRTNLDLYGHSRGTLTIHNSMQSQVNAGNGKVMEGTDLTYYGAAANAQESADLYGQLGGKAKFAAENNDYDIVSNPIGGNDSSFAKGRGLSRLKEIKDTFFSGNDGISPHRCYGGGAVAACGTRYGPREYRIYTPFGKQTYTVPEADYLRSMKHKK